MTDAASLSLREQDAIKFLELLLSKCSGTGDHNWRKCRRCLAFNELEYVYQPLARSFITTALEALRSNAEVLARESSLRAQVEAKLDAAKRSKQREYTHDEYRIIHDGYDSVAVRFYEGQIAAFESVLALLGDDHG